MPIENTCNACRNFCHKIPYRILAAILCVLLVIAQGSLLNYYLAKHKNSLWWLWSIADAASVAAFIVAFVFTLRHFETHKKNEHKKSGKKKVGGELPMGYIAWAVYSIFLAIRVGIIFEDIAGKLLEKEFFGPNTLKTTISLSCLIFLLLVATHHDASHDSARKVFINSITHGVTFDILDTVSILNVLFIQESHIFLTFSMHKAINAIACLNLILPIIPLLMLSQTRFGKDKVNKTLRTIHTLLNLLFINVSLFVIRMLLWHVYIRDISIFFIKNILGICFTIKGVWDLWLIKPQDKTDTVQVEGSEMKPLDKPSATAATSVNVPEETVGETAF